MGCVMDSPCCNLCLGAKFSPTLINIWMDFTYNLRHGKIIPNWAVKCNRKIIVLRKEVALMIHHLCKKNWSWLNNIILQKEKKVFFCNLVHLTWVEIFDAALSWQRSLDRIDWPNVVKERVKGTDAKIKLLDRSFVFAKFQFNLRLRTYFRFIFW